MSSRCKELGSRSRFEAEESHDIESQATGKSNLLTAMGSALFGIYEVAQGLEPEVKEGETEMPPKQLAPSRLSSAGSAHCHWHCYHAKPESRVTILSTISLGLPRRPLLRSCDTSCDGLRHVRP